MALFKSDLPPIIHQLETAAYRYLSSRPRFSHEVVSFLQTYAHDHSLSPKTDDINQVITSLKRQSYLDDADLYRKITLHYLEDKLKGPLLIRQYLLKRGCPPDRIQATLDRFVTPKRLQTSLSKLMTKKIKRGADTSSYQLKAKIVRYCLSRGFPASSIYTAFDDWG